MNTAKAAAEAPRDLQIADHTAIIDFCLRHRAELRDDGSKPRNGADVLAQAAALAKGQKIGETLSVAAFHARAIDATLRKTDLKHQYWVEGLPILGRLSASLPMDPGGCLAFVRQRRKGASEPMATIFDTCAGILADGIDTIYNPEYWVVYQVFDPREYVGSLYQGVQDLLDGGMAEAGKIAGADLIGGILGGIGGAIGGAVFGGGAGAIVDGAKRAIGGAVATSGAVAS
jgi:hypothetical protein